MSETEAKDSGWVLPSASRWLSTSEQTFASPAPATAEAASKSPSKASVLIVEDDASARMAISRILKKLGFAVSEAGTIREALVSLDESPDWILLDLMLPDGCGIGVIDEVRARQ